MNGLCFYFWLVRGVCSSPVLRVCCNPCLFLLRGVRLCVRVLCILFWRCFGAGAVLPDSPREGALAQSWCSILYRNPFWCCFLFSPQAESERDATVLSMRYGVPGHLPLIYKYLNICIYIYIFVLFHTTGYIIRSISSTVIVSSRCRRFQRPLQPCECARVAWRSRANRRKHRRRNTSQLYYLALKKVSCCPPASGLACVVVETLLTLARVVIEIPGGARFAIYPYCQ